MQKIALVMPYYGKLPVYFNYWLRSLRGKVLDVFFFSDLDVKEYPENFYPIKMTFAEFKILAKEKLGVPVRLDSPRRLCDFKPMYGKIFEDWLKDYDYWAFGDCDLVYGNKFNVELQNAIASDCDVFSLHRHYVSGPFCMIKNCSKMNELWGFADNAEEVVSRSGSQCVAFDELSGEWHNQLSSGEMSIDDCRHVQDSFTAVIMRTPGLMLRMNEIIDESPLTHGGVVISSYNGSLQKNGKEIPLFHFLGIKMRGYCRLQPFDYDNDQLIVIDDAGSYVTSVQRCLRPILRTGRKFCAAWRSICKNGIYRLWK